MMNLFQPRRQQAAGGMANIRQPYGNFQAMGFPQPRAAFPPRLPQRQAVPQHDPMITFEPLDEGTMKQLKVIQGGMPTVRAGSTEDLHQGEAEEATEKDKQIFIARDDVTVIAEIGRFIQNERNAAIFYEKLSEKAADGYHKNILKHIAENSRKNVRLYGGVYKEYKGAEFEAGEEEIEADINFAAGIRLAIMEENNMLNELTNIYDMVKSDRVIKLLTAALQKKHSTISNLFSMGMNFR